MWLYIRQCVGTELWLMAALHINEKVCARNCKKIQSLSWRAGSLSRVQERDHRKDRHLNALPPKAEPIGGASQGPAGWEFGGNLEKWQLSWLRPSSVPVFVTFRLHYDQRARRGQNGGPKEVVAFPTHSGMMVSSWTLQSLVLASEESDPFQKPARQSFGQTSAEKNYVILRFPSATPHVSLTFPRSSLPVSPLSCSWDRLSRHCRCGQMLGL